MILFYFSVMISLMSNKVILWIIVFVAGAGLIFSANFFRDKGSGGVSLETPAPSETISPLPSPSPSLRPTSVQVAASCQITGQIVFLDKNFYENKGAKIVYQNVDDPIRQIFWKSNPDDGVLAIGPNLFEDLPLPDGSRNVGLTINKEPFAQNYTLTASITYGARNARGIVEDRIADCTGKVFVQMP
ncbi:MAG: hypothetical protein A2913_01175 [Parcubacteria group bacterium RIFCSPLOWO2_01_FULL_40_65]|nr:MAG: hypothetical protein A3D40_02540 [Parcubacteria group bacterium RIFCSPHIGHO2_02_FULL_40_12]OHB22099.1 MAG: hypothetical protein A2913_01175 [Parcubacteria group bacterium RIFCSPLOWO2_01_FULL_40_65]OHB23694.1 MAG: hypothetical protein A3I22_02575 [Parcubacteria group bacterium RIFCSPLOWO2_02_FULL_40_12]